MLEAELRWWQKPKRDLGRRGMMEAARDSNIQCGRSLWMGAQSRALFFNDDGDEGREDPSGDGCHRGKGFELEIGNNKQQQQQQSLIQ